MHYATRLADIYWNDGKNKQIMLLSSPSVIFLFSGPHLSEQAKA